jgi:hypothetical protein
VKKVHYKVSFQVELKKNHQDINKTFPMRTWMLQPIIIIVQAVEVVLIKKLIIILKAHFQLIILVHKIEILLDILRENRYLSSLSIQIITKIIITMKVKKWYRI